MYGYRGCKGGCGKKENLPKFSKLMCSRRAKVDTTFDAFFQTFVSSRCIPTPTLQSCLSRPYQFHYPPSSSSLPIVSVSIAKSVRPHPTFPPSFFPWKVLPWGIISLHPSDAEQTHTPTFLEIFAFRQQRFLAKFAVFVLFVTHDVFCDLACKKFCSVRVSK